MCLSCWPALLPKCENLIYFMVIFAAVLLFSANYYEVFSVFWIFDCQTLGLLDVYYINE